MLQYIVDLVLPIQENWQSIVVTSLSSMCSSNASSAVSKRTEGLELTAAMVRVHLELLVLKFSWTGLGLVNVG